MQNPYRKPVAMTKRVSLYAAIIIALLIGGIFGTSWVLGYRIDPVEQTVERIGLLQFGSTPSNAAITVDNSLLNFNTPGRFETSVGEKQLAYYLEGYHSWQKRINLTAAQLRWLNYARLLPAQIESEPIQAFSKVDDMLTAPDRAHALILQDVTRNLFTSVNFSRSSEPELSTIAIPADALTYRSLPTLPTAPVAINSIDPIDQLQLYKPIESLVADPAVVPVKFAMVEYESSSVYVLIQVTYSNNTAQFIILNTSNPSSSINLSQKVNLPISSTHFIGKSGSSFFVLVAGQLREVNLYRSSISKSLANHVTNYNIYGEDKLLYISQLESTWTGHTVIQVGLYDNFRQRNHILATYGSTDLILAAWTHYYDEDYVAIYRSGKLKLIVNPIAETNTKPEVTTLDLAALFAQGEVAPDWIQFNGTGRFIVAGCGTQLYTYDLEYREIALFSPSEYQPEQASPVAFQFATTNTNLSGSTSPLKWLDDFYLQYQTVDGYLAWTEFDGQNTHKIASGQTPALITADDEWIYYIARLAGNAELRSSNLVTTQ